MKIAGFPKKLSSKPNINQILTTRKPKNRLFWLTQPKNMVLATFSREQNSARNGVKNPRLYIISMLPEHSRTSPGAPRALPDLSQGPGQGSPGPFETRPVLPEESSSGASRMHPRMSRRALRVFPDHFWGSPRPLRDIPGPSGGLPDL